MQDPPASDCQRCQIPGKKFFSFPKLQRENAEKCRVHTHHTHTYRNLAPASEEFKLGLVRGMGGGEGTRSGAGGQGAT